MNCSANIVYSNSWLNQTESISPTTVFTFPAGLFRVSIGADISGVGANGQFPSLEVQISAALENGVSIITTGASLAAGQPNAANFGGSGPLTSQVPSGTELSLTTALDVPEGSTLTGYDVFVTVEQLQ